RAELNLWKPFLNTTGNIGVGTAALLVQSWVQDLELPDPALVLTNSDYWVHPNVHDDNPFSGQGYKQAIARIQYGAQVLPVEAVEAEPSSTYNALPETGEPLIEARAGDPPARVTFNRPWMELD